MSDPWRKWSAKTWKIEGEKPAWKRRGEKLWGLFRASLRSSPRRQRGKKKLDRDFQRTLRVTSGGVSLPYSEACFRLRRVDRSGPAPSHHVDQTRLPEPDATLPLPRALETPVISTVGPPATRILVRAETFMSLHLRNRAITSTQQIACVSVKMVPCACAMAAPFCSEARFAPSRC